MEDRYLILSDIHGNVSAFNAVLEECRGEDFTGIILLGDLIDYGMRSNEIMGMIRELGVTEWKDKIKVNIWGNHGKLFFDKDLERLSSDRGRVMAKYTADHISDESAEYIGSSMNREGLEEFSVGGLRCLAVHGSLDDRYWKAIGPGELRGDYSGYDLVFSGHSHYSHCFAHFYPSDNAELRNKKAVTFINPGSVGQPRNHNPYAQYGILDVESGNYEHRCVWYDVKEEQKLFSDSVDIFYKDRLILGI